MFALNLSHDGDKYQLPKEVEKLYRKRYKSNINAPYNFIETLNLLRIDKANSPADRIRWASQYHER